MAVAAVLVLTGPRPISLFVHSYSVLSIIMKKEEKNRKDESVFNF
jgi:hypothetical protein